MIDAVELLYRPQKMKLIERALLWTMALLLVAVGAYTVRWEMIDAEHVRRVVDTALEHPLPLLPVLAAVLVSFLIPAKMRRTRIRVDASGMQAINSLPLLGETVERKISWDKVSSVSYVRSTSALSIRTKAGLPWVLRAADWSRAGSSAISNAASTSAEPDLVAIMRGLGLLERKFAATAIDEFDLMSNRRTRLLIVLAALAGLYAVIDGMMNPESWAFFNLEYEIPHVIIGVLLAIGAGAWLARPSTGPTLDRLIVAGMAFFVFIVAVPTSYVGLIRVNQLVGGPLQAHDYHRDAACMNLVPADPSLPVIEYTEVTRAYWCQVRREQPVSVLVRQGLFGLYQVNLESQTESIRRFRDGK